MGNKPGRLFHIAIVVAMGGILGCPVVPAPTDPGPSNPELDVFPSGFSFNQSFTQDTFTISNNGTGNLDWTITTQQSWISFSATTGTATPTAPSNVTITVDPSALGTIKQTSLLGSFTVSSIGGSVQVPVAIQVGGTGTSDVPELAVSTTAIDFGNTSTVQQFTISNNGPGSFDYTITQAGDNFITTIQSDTGTVSNVAQPVTVTIDRGSLAAGAYAATLTVDAGTAGSATINVTMSVGAAAPVLSITPTSLNFGDTGNVQSFTITNTGGGNLNWTASSDQAFATLSSAGDVAAAGESDTVNVTVNRTGLPVGVQTATITVTAGTLTGTVSVSLNVVDAALVVTPTTLNFGSGANTRLITISNPGVGTLNWNIPAPSVPWLTVMPTSGTVTDEADAVVVEIDRTLLAAGNHSTTFQVQSSNAGINPVTITVNAVVLIPVLEIDSATIDNATSQPLVSQAGNPVVEFGTTINQSGFTIRNTGNGFLNWNIDPASLPDWLLIAPVSGTLGENAEQFVTVGVNRDRDAGAYFHEVMVETSTGTAIVEVSMTVSGRVEIVVEPTTINLGLFENVSTFAVANNGDPDTVLNFTIESNRDWLFGDPETGFSIGVPTPLPFKDFRTINVSIDRGGLDGTGGTGTFTIRAVDEEGKVLTDVEPQTVVVSVEAASLTFQQAIAQTRIPSLTRFTFLMRDITYDTFDIDATTIPASNFQIFEDNVALEVTETNQFIDNTHTPAGLTTNGRGKARTNLLVLLDFSGSTADTAGDIGQNLQTIYANLLTTFINNIPDDFNVGVYEFHDRGFLLGEVSAFTQDRAQTLADIGGNLGITDNGSTDLFDFLTTATGVLATADGFIAQSPGAQITGMVILSDGRVTTPPGELQDLVDVAVATRTRFFTVPFGENVNNQILASLATQTGGHHYNTPPTANDLPDLTVLDGIMQELATDLRRHLVLNYVTLEEENNTVTRVNANVDIPNDGRGAVTGTFEQTLNFMDVAGDVRLGQISMESSPQTNGDTVVRIRADYIPRNINKLAFTIDTSGACNANPAGINFTVAQVAASDGGLIETWTPDAGNTAGTVSTGTYRFDAPANEVLRYGDFGDLIEIRFASGSLPGGTPPFTLCLTVDNTIYAGDPDFKYFISPDSITVRDRLSFAPSFPTPVFDANPATPAIDLTIDFGAGASTDSGELRNVGGFFDYPASSDAELQFGIANSPAFIDVNPESGVIRSTLPPQSPRTLNFVLDRSGDAGGFTETVEIEWEGGALNIGGTINVIVTGTILEPVMSPNADTLAFGNNSTEESFTVTNTGQSTLEWSVEDLATDVPPWATLSATSGFAGPGESDIVEVEIDRFSVEPGAQGFAFDIVSNGSNVAPNNSTQTVTVTATILNPNLTVSSNNIDFGTLSGSETLNITNTGQSTLDWTVVRAAPQPWLSFSVTSGTTKAEIDTIGLTVDRTGLAAGNYQETFQITSDGGNQTIIIDMEVP